MTYAQTVFQDRARVEGRRLLPLTVGHALLLQRLKSPFAPRDTRTAGAGDCALLLFVCSRSWQVASKTLDSLRCKPWLWLEWLRVGFRFGHNRAQLFRYVSEAWTGPEVWLEGKSEPQDDDSLRVIINTLCSRMGLRYQDALNMPLRQAVWEVCGFWADEGRLKFMAPHEIEMREQLKEMEGN